MNTYEYEPHYTGSIQPGEHLQLWLRDGTEFKGLVISRKQNIIIIEFTEPHRSPLYTYNTGDAKRLLIEDLIKCFRLVIPNPILTKHMLIDGKNVVI
jgi:hypothetical protein